MTGKQYRGLKLAEPAKTKSVTPSDFFEGRALQPTKQFRRLSPMDQPVSNQFEDPDPQIVEPGNPADIGRLQWPHNWPDCTVMKQLDD